MLQLNMYSYYESRCSVKKLYALIAFFFLLTGCCNISEPNDTTMQNKNIVVQHPTMNEVTYEIGENLVGKFVVINDPEMFFEINSDGKGYISLNALSGYAEYGGDSVQLTAFYTDEKVILNFNLVSGNFTFPASCGLSISFEGDVNCSSFLSTGYLSEYNLKFVRQT